MSEHDAMQAAREALTAGGFTEFRVFGRDSVWERRSDHGNNKVTLFGAAADEFCADINGALADLPALLRYKETAAENAALRQQIAAVMALPEQGKADEDIPDDKEDAYRLGYAAALADVRAALRTTPQETTAPATYTEEQVRKAVLFMFECWAMTEQRDVDAGTTEDPASFTDGVIEILGKEAPHGS